MAQTATTAREVRRALELLLRDAPPARGDLSGEALDRLEHYAGLLLAANARVNLTRLTDPADVARLHLLDALSALPILDRLTPDSALDLGSGGGVPGIPLAIARPGIAWVLVESIARKADALRSFVRELGLDGVLVVSERAETMGRAPEHRERYALVTARAVAPMPVLVELALPLVRGGGSLLAWKGPASDGDPELVRGETAAGMLAGGEFDVQPAAMAALGGHRLVVVSKRGHTPDRFPRRPGVAARRPLA